MATQIATLEDLDRFKQEIIQAIRNQGTAFKANPATWLKAAEVRKFLKISAGTLQNLRINGTLNPTKVGGTYYFPAKEIEALLSNK